jgi:hypothetical protein
MYVCTKTYLCLYIYTYIYAYVYINAYAYIYIHICIYIYIYKHVYMYIYMNIHIYDTGGNREKDETPVDTMNRYVRVFIWINIHHFYMIPLSYTSVYSPPPTYSLVLLFQTPVDTMNRYAMMMIFT